MAGIRAAVVIGSANEGVVANSSQPFELGSLSSVGSPLAIQTPQIPSPHNRPMRAPSDASHQSVLAKPQVISLVPGNNQPRIESYWLSSSLSSLGGDCEIFSQVRRNKESIHYVCTSRRTLLPGGRVVQVVRDSKACSLQLIGPDGKQQKTGLVIRTFSAHAKHFDLPKILSVNKDQFIIGWSELDGEGQHNIHGQLITTGDQGSIVSSKPFQLADYPGHFSLQRLSDSQFAIARTAVNRGGILFPAVRYEIFEIEKDSRKVSEIGSISLSGHNPSAPHIIGLGERQAIVWQSQKTSTSRNRVNIQIVDNIEDGKIKKSDKPLSLVAVDAIHNMSAPQAVFLGNDLMAVSYGGYTGGKKQSLNSYYYLYLQLIDVSGPIPKIIGDAIKVSAVPVHPRIPYTLKSARPGWVHIEFAQKTDSESEVSLTEMDYYVISARKSSQIPTEAPVITEDHSSLSPTTVVVTATGGLIMAAGTLIKATTTSAAHVSGNQLSEASDIESAFQLLQALTLLAVAALIFYFVKCRSPGQRQIGLNEVNISK